MERASENILTPTQETQMLVKSLEGRLFELAEGTVSINSNAVEPGYNLGAGFSEIENETNGKHYRSSRQVEVRRIELLSKHILQKLSTCLFAN